ncbi:MAG TPA: hypothetical protein PK504_02735 [Ferruginibacter sp.]|nr:hypothetical protein [Ferruginibacter sp.]
MEKLLALYLFQHKICPLPTVGTLLLQPGNAVALQADKLLNAPAPNVVFSVSEYNTEGLVQSLSTALNIDSTSARLTLENFCKSILQMGENSAIKFSNAGSFKKDENGQLFFEPAQPNAAFVQPTIAERVIHPQATHSMLVGDTHTNTVAMTEMLSAENQKRSLAWAWWSIGLAVAAASVIVFYSTGNNAAHFGNANKISPAKEPAATYSIGTK